jgi:hypothetical protein
MLVARIAGTSLALGEPTQRASALRWQSGIIPHDTPSDRHRHGRTKGPVSTALFGVFSASALSASTNSLKRWRTRQDSNL